MIVLTKKSLLVPDWADENSPVPMQAIFGFSLLCRQVGVRKLLQPRRL